MNYEERYVIRTKHTDGTESQEVADDLVTAAKLYSVAEDQCGHGESVRLQRNTSVVLAMRARA